MDKADFTQRIASLSPAELLEEVDIWIADNSKAPDLVGWLDDFVKSNPSFDTDTLQALRVALYFLAREKENRAFNSLCALLAMDGFKSDVKADDWIIPNMHRILGSIASPENVDTIETLVLDKTLTEETREQALLAIHFLWLEKVLNDRTVTEIYRRLIEESLKSGKIEERMAMALCLNSAVVGGVSLRTEIASVIDSGFLGENTETVAKAVQTIITQGKRFREIYAKEHKGFFMRPEDEIPTINEPVVEQIPEMPKKGTTIVRQAPKVGRNDPCPCGSGKKYKKCCGSNL